MQDKQSPSWAAIEKAEGTFFVQSCDSSAFVVENEPDWLRNPLAHRVFLKLRSNPPTDSKNLVVRDEEGMPVATAIFLPKDQIVLSKAPHDAIRALANFLLNESIYVPGIFAPAQEAASLAEYLNGHNDVQYQLAKRIWHWELKHPASIRPAQGSTRRADMADLTTIIAYRTALQNEGNTQRPYDPEPAIIRELEDGGVFVWELPDRQVATVGSIFINNDDEYGSIDGLYTRPELRHNGFASNLLLHLVNRILKQRSAVFLSSDADAVMPTRIYRQLGFAVRCEMANFREIAKTPNP